MTPSKPTVKKKAAAKKAAPEVGKNLARLLQARVIAPNHGDFSLAEKNAIESLSASEVSAIISARGKMGRNYSKLAAHGMYF